MEHGPITLQREQAARLLGGGIRFFLSAALTAICLMLIGTKTAFIAVIVTFAVLTACALWRFFGCRERVPVRRMLILLVTMALVFGLLYRALPNRVRVAAFFIASLLVPAGYFLYETILYGAVAAAPNLLFNLVQGLIGAGIALAVCKISEKTGLRGKQP